MKLTQTQKDVAHWLPLAAAMLYLLAFQPYSYRYWTEHRGTVLSEITKSWHANSEWEHCMAVVPILAWLLWNKRAQISAWKPQPNAWGVVLFVLGAGVYWFGYKTDIQYGAYVWWQLSVAGAVLWLYGWRCFGNILFPWIFMLFLWPLPFLDNIIAFPLRLMMSSCSHWVLAIGGLDNIRIGTAIVSAPVFGPDGMLMVKQGARFALDVADPCSGIRSLFALTMVTTLYGYLVFLKPADTTLQTGINEWKRAWMRWFLLLAAAAPLAIFGNLIRMLLLTFGTIWFGVDFAIGTASHPSWFHEAAGFAVFGAALAGMMGLAQLLELDWQASWTKAIETYQRIKATPHTAHITSPQARQHEDKY